MNEYSRTSERRACEFCGADNRADNVACVRCGLWKDHKYEKVSVERPSNQWCVLRNERIRKLRDLWMRMIPSAESEALSWAIERLEGMPEHWVAADEIERLTAERDRERNRYHDMLMQKEGYKDLAADRAADIERLRAALERIVKESVSMRAVEIARVALGDAHETPAVTPKTMFDLPIWNGDDLRRIAAVIDSRPVMGHWPALRAHIDAEVLRCAATMIDARPVETAPASPRRHATMKLSDSAYQEIFNLMWSMGCTHCFDGDDGIIPHGFRFVTADKTSVFRCGMSQCPGHEDLRSVCDTALSGVAK